MKKKAVIMLMSCVMSLPLLGQTKELKTYYYNGKVKSIYHYTDEQNYEVKNFNTQGQLVETGKFVNGLMHGIWKTFDDNGLLTAEASYQMGKKEGEWIIYTAGKATSKMYYVNNQLLRAVSCDENGNIIADRVTKP